MLGRSFLVLHDKRLYQPPQQSFTDTDIVELSEAGSGYNGQADVRRFGQLQELKDFDDSVDDWCFSLKKYPENISKELLKCVVNLVCRRI